MKLTKFEETLTEQQLFLHWLKIGKVNFSSLAASYVGYLEEKRQENNGLIAGLTVPLIQYWQSCHLEPKKHDLWMRGKAAYYLLKSRMFETAPVEKELVNCLKESNFKEL